MSVETVYRPGLKEVIVSESQICFIDGQEGILRYRGYDIGELAENSSFEEACYLLLYGELPTREQRDRFSAELKSRRALSDRELELIRSLAATAEPMDALRTAVSAAGSFDPWGSDNSDEASLNKVTRIIAIFPSILASYKRFREGQEPIPPRDDLNHASNLLYMMSGEDPDETSSSIFDTCLTLHADHGFNASTFSARVTVSTLSDIYAAVTSAIATLKGPLHGGANIRVIEMLEEIGSEERVRSYIEEKLQSKQKIWGMGHRVYKTKDPRSYVLETLIEELARVRGESKLYRIARETERVCAELLAEKGIYPNVDFYSGTICQMLEIPKELAPPLFALSRVSGWTAHVMEQLRDNVLIRPRSRYVGPEKRKYVPIDQR